MSVSLNSAVGSSNVDPASQASVIMAARGQDLQKMQGQQATELINASATPARSANQPGQGGALDATG